MATIGQRILEAIRYGPLDDDQLARRLGVSPRQSINQTARHLEAQGKLHYFGNTPDGLDGLDGLEQLRAPMSVTGAG